MTTKDYTGTFSTANWPVLVITPEEDMTDPEILKYIQDFNGFIDEKKERYAMAIDLKHGRGLRAKQRKLLVDNMKRRKEFNEKYCAGVALVFDSPVIRGTAMAMMWLFKPSFPIKVFKRREKAIRWCEVRLERTASVTE
jgi:hypothetical protein